MKSTVELLAAGLKAQAAKHASGEGAKLGAYRVGSSGVLAMGKVVGGCIRLAHLRSLGVEADSAEESREHMFAAGRSNEDIWKALLLASEEPGLSVLREEEFPVTHRLPNGKMLLGRPDIVLLQNGVPARLLELKLASSMYTALDVYVLGKPKLDHVIQAAHYSLRLGLPIELWYASRADFHLVDRAKEKVPPGLPGVVYGWDQKAMKLSPFLVGYVLRTKENGQVTYQRIGLNPDGSEPQEVSTIVSTQGLDQFFDQLSRLGETDELPAMPSKVDLLGGEASWRKCDYCSLKPLCLSQKKGSVKDWVEAARKFLSEPKEILSASVKVLEKATDKVKSTSPSLSAEEDRP